MGTITATRISRQDGNSQRVAEAFSRQASGYDDYDEKNVILQWMRRRVRAHASRFVRPGDRILELNAGTGIDAVYFAHQGCRVHATDVSDGMIEQIRKKIEKENLQDWLTVQQCSYAELHNVKERDFDFVFSNFGGLNCTPDLTAVAEELNKLMRPGAFATLVIMPRISPWEMIMALKGNLHHAFRRLHRGGSEAHIMGVYFRSYYFSPGQVVHWFGHRFEKMRLEGLGAWSPPPYMENFPIQHPHLYSRLTRLDEFTGRWPLLNRWADHFILTLKFHG